MSASAETSAGLAFLGLMPTLTTLAWKISKMGKKRFLEFERKYTATHLSTQVFCCKLVINDFWFSSENEAVSYNGMFFIYFLNTCYWWRADCRWSSQINHACGVQELLWAIFWLSAHKKDQIIVDCALFFLWTNREYKLSVKIMQITLNCLALFRKQLSIYFPEFKTFYQQRVVTSSFRCIK